MRVKFSLDLELFRSFEEIDIQIRIKQAMFQLSPIPIFPHVKYHLFCNTIEVKKVVIWDTLA